MLLLSLDRFAPRHHHQVLSPGAEPSPLP